MSAVVPAELAYRLSVKIYLFDIYHSDSSFFIKDCLPFLFEAARLRCFFFEASTNS